jgi:hypothetical protein
MKVCPDSSSTPAADFVDFADSSDKEEHMVNMCFIEIKSEMMYNLWMMNPNLLMMSCMMHLNHYMMNLRNRFKIWLIKKKLYMFTYREINFRKESLHCA